VVLVFDELEQMLVEHVKPDIDAYLLDHRTRHTNSCFARIVDNTFLVKIRQEKS
jgi:hypothetical protein